MVISRRACLGQITGASLFSALNEWPLLAAGREASVLEERDSKSLSTLARAFLERYKAPGLSVAIARQGRLVYQEAFGFADKEAPEALSPLHAFRIASISKPVTSAAIYCLIEQGKLKLTDIVFGEKGLLGADYKAPPSDGLNAITVHHLLTHTCGGWSNAKRDPMFLNPKMGHRELIEWTLKNIPLEQAPGTHYDYSNFGYCLLGRIIEKSTGKSYAEALQQLVLQKCDITSMQIAGNTRDERLKNEVVYYGKKGEDPYTMNIRRMDAHGGWVGTPSDLVAFATHVDGFASPADILRPETITTMTTPSSSSDTYASGWAVNKHGNWWHNGSIPGVSTLLVRTASGFCWAAFTNTRSNGISKALDELLWKMVRSVPAWQV